MARTLPQHVRDLLERHGFAAQIVTPQQLVLMFEARALLEGGATLAASREDRAPSTDSEAPPHAA